MSPSTDQEAFVKSDVEEEEVDETMESVSVTVTEYSEEEEEEEREGDEEENDTVNRNTTCLSETLYLRERGPHNLTCIQLFVHSVTYHPCFYSLAANYS